MQSTEHSLFLLCFHGLARQIAGGFLSVMFKKLSQMKKRMISVSREKMEVGERLWLMIKYACFNGKRTEKGIFYKGFHMKYTAESTEIINKISELFKAIGILQTFSYLYLYKTGKKRFQD